MGLTIHLLGTPQVKRDGVNRTPAGRKTWSLLAYLALSEIPPSRERVAELLLQFAAFLP